MLGSRAPRHSFASGPLRFGPLALLLVGTIAAAVTSVEKAPRSSPAGTTKRLSYPSTTVTTEPVTTTTSTSRPNGSPSSPVPWAAMVNGLDLSPESVSCPSTTLCVFTGGATQFAGQQERAVSASTGPFAPGRTITGHLIDLPQATVFGRWYVSCPSTTVCLMSSPDTLYATTSPRTGPWTSQLTAPLGSEFSDVSCVGTTFCAVILGNDILISRSPLGGAGTWTTSGLPQLSDQGAGVGVLSCPSPQLCVAGGSSGTVGGWIEVSTDPDGGSQAWSGGPIVHPLSAQHSGEYSITDLSCPTTRFCLAVGDGGPLYVSTDPAGGPSTWQLASTTYSPYSYEVAPGIAACGADGRCSVTGTGTFQSLAGAPGPGFAGFPPSQVSCVTVSFCVSLDPNANNQPELGGINGTAEG